MKSCNLVFSFMIIDEIYTFYKNKDKKSYIWASIAVDSNNKYYYFYKLTKYKNTKALKSFSIDLPTNVNTIHTDGNFCYGKVYKDNLIQKKLYKYYRES